MAKSVFKGNLRTGDVVATFRADFSNVDPDLLVASYADTDGGNVQSPHVAITPGGAGMVTVKAVRRGLLEVMVVTGHEEETGQLEVTLDGETQHDAAITGPVSWLYMVVE